LGEEIRAVVLSTTEGEDKPLKYPRAFKTAQVVIVNKTDLAGSDRDAAIANVRAVAPEATVFELSARTGQGMDAWYAYLDELIRSRR
jgi:hydrogenase nickel incorporation protein HypB